MKKSLNPDLCRILFYFLLFALEGKNSYFKSYALLPTSMWSPGGIMAVLFPLPLTYEAANLLHLTWQASLLTSMLGLFTRTSILISSVSGFILIGISYSYGYFNHVYLPIALTLLIMPMIPFGKNLSIDALIFRKKNSKSNQDANDYMFYARAILTIIFFLAGYSKLKNGGIEWLSGETLSNYIIRSPLLFHDVNPLANSLSLNLRIANINWICKFLSYFTVIIELAAPLALLPSRFFKWIIPALFVMQIGIYFTIYVNFRVYLCLYIFWVDWEYHYLKLKALIVKPKLA